MPKKRTARQRKAAAARASSARRAADREIRQLRGAASRDLEAVVATVLEDRDAGAAWDVVADLEDLVAEDLDLAEIELMAYLATLRHWTASARTHGLDAAATLAWAEEHLDTDAAELALVAAGFVGHPDAEPMSLDTALDLVGTELIVGLLALAAGVVATSGGGDAAWLRQWNAG